MKVKVRPKFGAVKNGMAEIRLNDWEEFHWFIESEMLDYREYIYRGQSRADWPLRTTLDRLAMQARGRALTEAEMKDHLLRFKYSTRGRLPTTFHEDLGDNHWWAVGQHFGLATPLLDWTESPYVAAYFAFAEPSGTDNEPLPDRAIYALDSVSLIARSKELASADPQRNAEFVEVFSPLAGENNRLVSQRGLFTRLPVGQDLEDWIRTHFKGESNLLILVKIVIPERVGDRTRFFRVLNRMNVNALTLFPDLAGASLHCNHDLAIENY
ncbi:FRG domain-containing protein [Longimicrobium sp.]|uniref:FRG domain-containing protein n=1 Tax=Longimicrobium sp. TaxID=2029185 RepID=UPI003B3B1BD6